ncbi:hypothetical protein [Sediminivirga luteola]|uniref:hypothetical protein n=1 Tax=Sediminivirga luteola TaxID=1774748 RepID=UPI001F59FA6C|nr:hypothetical protein [Sediminivirga luteola]MCI2266122.1 hypothetical protein [Sediminivirga luteola]
MTVEIIGIGISVAILVAVGWKNWGVRWGDLSWSARFEQLYTIGFGLTLVAMTLMVTFQQFTLNASWTVIGCFALALLLWAAQGVAAWREVQQEQYEAASAGRPVPPSTMSPWWVGGAVLVVALAAVFVYFVGMVGFTVLTTYEAQLSGQAPRAAVVDGLVSGATVVVAAALVATVAAWWIQKVRYTRAWQLYTVAVAAFEKKYGAEGGRVELPSGALPRPRQSFDGQQSAL